MGTDQTNSRDLRGFAIPLPITKSSIWTQQASYTEAGNTSGSPQPAQSTGLGLVTTGSQTSKIKVRTQKAGHAGSAGFVWTYPDLMTETWYGKDPDNAISFWETTYHGVPSSGADYFKPLDSIGSASGNSYILSRYYDGSDYGVMVHKRDTTGAWSSTAIYEEGTSVTIAFVYGSICELPDGSLIAAHWVNNLSLAQITVHRSDDEGATWTTISKEALPEAIDMAGTFGAGNTGAEPQKIRMRAIKGQVMLIANVWTHNTSQSNTSDVYQYVSIDEGCSFVNISNTDGSYLFNFPELVVSKGHFIMIYVESTDSLKALRFPDAFTGPDTARSFSSYVTSVSSNVVGGGLTDKHLTTGQVAAWVDSTGRIFVAYEAVGNNGRLCMSISDDGAKTWNGAGGGTSTTLSQIWEMNTANFRLDWITGCMHGATSLLACNWDSISNTYEGIIGVAHLGGYSSITLPTTIRYGLFHQRMGWSYTFQGFETPDNASIFTVAGAGSTAISSDGYFSVTTGAGQSRTYTASGASFPASSDMITKGIILRVVFTCVSGGSTTIADKSPGVFVRLSNGVTSYALWIRADESNVDIYQTGTIGTASINTTNGVEVLLAMNNKVSAWVKTREAGPKKWTQLCNNATLASGTSLGSALEFGNLNNGARVSRWYEVSWKNAPANSQLADTTFTNPSDLYETTYTGRGNYRYIDEGLSISSFDGPAREADTYTIETFYRYGIQNLFYATSPTPQRTWRSASVSSGNTPENFIPFYIDTTIAANEETELQNNLVAMHLNNINFQTFLLQRYDTGTAAWVTMHTIDNTIGPFSYTRKGTSIKSGSGAGPYFSMHEMAGWKVKLDNGAGTIVYRTIKSNSAGALNNQTTKNCIVELADALHTDPTSGTAYIIPNQCTVIIDTQGETGAAWGLRISAQETPELYFEIGTMVFGPVAIFGKQWAHGRELTWKAGTELTTQNDGIQRARKKGENFRTITLGWSDGIDTNELYKENSNPDYYKATAGGNPIAAIDNPQAVLEGILRFCNGGEIPLVFIPRMQYQTDTFWVLNRKAKHMLCTLQDDITVENVVGNEWSQEGNGEFMRISQISFREVI